MNGIVKVVCGMGMAACMSVFSSGCAHSLVVKNMNAYRVPAEKRMSTARSVGVVTSATNVHERAMIAGVAAGLSNRCARVVYPYVTNGADRVDVVANIELNSEYRGSGANILLDWPGFLVWAPALNGYVYKANHRFVVTLADGGTESVLDTFGVPVNLNLRHAAMNRTWMAEVGGWLMPGLSGVALVGGVMHRKYDPQVTPLVAQETAVPVGDYVAERIVGRLAAPMNASAAVTSAVK